MLRKFTGLVFTSLFIFSFALAPLAEAQTVTIAQLQEEIASLTKQLNTLIASQSGTTVSASASTNIFSNPNSLLPAGYTEVYTQHNYNKTWHVFYSTSAHTWITKKTDDGSGNTDWTHPAVSTVADLGNSNNCGLIDSESSRNGCIGTAIAGSIQALTAQYSLQQSTSNSAVVVMDMPGRIASYGILYVPSQMTWSSVKVQNGQATWTHPGLTASGLASECNFIQNDNQSGTLTSMLPAVSISTYLKTLLIGGILYPVIGANPVLATTLTTILPGNGVDQVAVNNCAYNSVLAAYGVTGSTSTIVTNPTTPTTQTGAPTIDIKANNSNGPLSVDIYTGVNLSWTTSSQFLSFCSLNANGTFVASVNSNGTRNMGGVNTKTIYQINCLNSSGVGSTSINDSVEVDPAAQNTTSTTNKFSIGDTVETTSAANVRTSPNGTLYGTLLGEQPANMFGTVVGGPIPAAGFTWWNVNYDNQPSGWSSDTNLVKATRAITQTTGVPVVTLSVSPTSISVGQSALLYATNNLLNQSGTCSLNGQQTALGGGPNGRGMSPMTINPTQTTTYTYTCTNSSGVVSAPSTVTITVGSTQTTGAPVVTLTANPTSITAGQSALLYATNNFLNQNGASCTLNGQQTALGGGPNGSGMSPATITPTQTTTYTYVCTNSTGQSASASVTVTVGSTIVNTSSAPTIYSITPAIVGQGGQATVTGLGSTGGAFLQGSYILIDGNQSVDPITQTPYSLTFVVPSNLSQYNHTIKIGEKAGNVSGTSQTLSVISGINTTPLPSGQQKINAWLAAPVNWSLVSAGALTPIYQQAIRSHTGATTYLDYNTGAVTTNPAGAVQDPNFVIQGKFLQGLPVSESERAYVGYNDPSDIGVYYNIASDGTVTAKTNTTGLTTGTSVVLTANGASASTTVVPGTSVDLHWSANNVSACYGGGWSGQAGQTNIGGSGDSYVTPTQTTTYTINCLGLTGSGGINSSVTVNVAAATQTAVPTIALYASPSAINQGQSTTLNWTVSTNANSCNESWSSSTVPMAGSQVVAPTQTTTYTLTCSNSAGVSAPSIATVNVAAATQTPVTPAPTVNIFASPTSITSGQSVGISYSSTNATSCTGNISNGTSGYVYVYPTQTTTYTETCTGAGGTASNSATINVTQSSTTGGSTFTDSNATSVYVALQQLLQQMSQLIK